MTKGPTRIVDDDNAVENVRARVARELRKLPRVDSQGRVVDPNAEPTVAIIGAPLPPATSVPTVTAAPTPGIVETLMQVAVEQGVNFDALVDSRRFIERVVKAETADPATLTTLVGEALAENPRLALATPTMRPNPGQGSSARPPAPKPQTVAERIAERLAKTPPVDRQGHTVR